MSIVDELREMMKSYEEYGGKQPMVLSMPMRVFDALDEEIKTTRIIVQDERPKQLEPGCVGEFYGVPIMIDRDLPDGWVGLEPSEARRKRLERGKSEGKSDIHRVG